MHFRQGIYPEDPDSDGNTCHFFIEFREKYSVKRARALQVPGVQVQVLAFCPSQTVDRFHSVAPSLPSHTTYSHCKYKADGRDSGRSSSPSSFEQPYPRGHRALDAQQNSVEHPPFDVRRPRKTRKGHGGRGGKGWFRGRYSSRTNASSGTRYSSPYSTSSIQVEGDHSSKRSKRFHWSEKERDKENNSSPVVPHASSSREYPHDPSNDYARFDAVRDVRHFASPYPSTIPILDHSMTRPPSSTYSAEDFRSMFDMSPMTSVTSPGSSPSPSIILVFGGQQIVCELDRMNDDPGEIITVLKATASQMQERDKWMIVGGHYRSRGNVRAAIAVISTMIEGRPI